MRVRGKRALLNGTGFQSTAAIVAEVEDTRGWRKGRDGEGQPLAKKNHYDYEPETRLAISDCTRTIDLAMEWKTAQSRRNSLRKVDRLIDALVVFRSGLVEEQALYAERDKAASRAKEDAA